MLRNRKPFWLTRPLKYRLPFALGAAVLMLFTWRERVLGQDPVPTNPHASATKPVIAAAPRARITGLPNRSHVFEVKGSVNPRARAAADHGRLAGSEAIQGMQLILTSTEEQRQALDELIQQQQNPQSPNFHQWVTPDEFGAHFGADPADIEAASAWLATQGFQVKGPSHGRLTLEFSGTAAQVEAAFGTQMHRYSAEGRESYANATPVHLPAAFSGVVAGIHGLHNFPAKRSIRYSAVGNSGSRPKAGSQNGKQAGSASGAAAVSARPDIYFAPYIQQAFTPADLRVMYNVPASSTGAGIRIGLPEANDPTGGFSGSASAPVNKDYNNFNTIMGLPSGHLSYVLAGVDPGTACGSVDAYYNCSNGGSAATEATLDMETVHGLAPQANIVMAVAPDPATAITYLVDNNLVDVISTSYGYAFAVDSTGDATYWANLYAQASAQGISCVNASGDNGSASYGGINITDGADFSSTNAYVTDVGGTSPNSGVNGTYWWGINALDFSHSSLHGHIPEDSWNGSGGGTVTLYPKPAWQTGVPGTYTGSTRDFPDVALTAIPEVPYLICANGSCNNTTTPNFYPVGGTSASSPAFGAIVALLAQKQGGRLGLLNPTLYKLGAGQNWGNCNGSSQSTTPPPSSCVFYDITTGSNAQPGQTGYGTPSATYFAGFGYDRVTGLGSVNVTTLLNSWGSVSYNPTSTTFSIQPAAFYGDDVTVSGQVTGGTGTPTGFVTFVDAAGGHGVLPLAADGTYSGTVTGFAIGTDSVKAQYGGDSTFARSTSAAQSITISKVTTTTSANFTNASTAEVVSGPVGYGSGNYTLNISVAGITSYGVPGGNVVVTYTRASTGSTSYYVGTVPLAAGADGTSGVASIQEIPSITPPDTYNFTINYAGDAIFNAAPAASTSITITKAPTSLTVGVNPNSATVHSSVQLRALAAFAQSQTAPTGSVQFYQNGVALGAPVALGGASVSGGAYLATATLNTTGLLPGTDSITATYTGDANNSAATAAAQSASILGASAAISISADRTSNIYAGSVVNLTATLLGQPASAVTGSVQFFTNGSTSLGKATLTSGITGGTQSGTATLPTTGLAAGTNTVYAVYSGDANYNPGTSFAITIVVTAVIPNGLLSPSALSFPTTSVGSPSAFLPVTLTDPGTGSLTVGTVSITGTNAGSFSQTNSCTTGRILLPYTEACYIQVTFNPQSAGTLTANLVVTDNSASSPHTTVLTGTGVPAGGYLSFSTTQLNFGFQTTGTTSSAQSITITNIGNANVTGLGFGSAPADYAVNGSACSATLAPGATCTASITFTPLSAGAANESVALSWTGASAHVTTISFNGVGEAIAASSFSNSIRQLPGTFTQPAAVVADASGNYYVSDTANNAVYRVDPMGNQTTLPIAGLTAPGAMTFDGAGNLYVVSNGGLHNINVIKYTSPSQQTAYLFFGATSAAGLAVDTNGTMYITDPAISSVWSRTSSGTSAAQIGFGALGLFPNGGIAIDSSNNLYVTGGGKLNRIPNLTGSPVTVASYTNPVALAIGAGDSVYVADSTTNQVSVYLNGSTFVLNTSSLLSGVSAIYQDHLYGTYFVNGSTRKVYKSSTLGNVNAGPVVVGTASTLEVSLRVPNGNSIASLSVTDVAGNSEWSLPTGNTCTVANNVCSFHVNLTAAYPGPRGGTLTVQDAIGHSFYVNLYGTGVGPEAVLLTGNKSTAATVWRAPVLHTDSAGNVYALDQTSPSQPAIQKIAPNGATSTALSLGTLLGPTQDFGVDGQGNFLVKGAGSAGPIFKTSGGVINAALGAGFGSGPFAADQAGNTYESYGNQVTITNAAGTSLPPLSYGSGSSVILAIATDGLQNFFVATNEPAIYRTSYSGVTTKLLDNTTSPGGYQLSNPTGLAEDASGSVWAADAGANALFHVDPQGNTVAYGLGLAHPTALGVAVTPQGAIFVSDAANAAIYRFDPASGAFAFGTTGAKAPTPVQSVLLLNAGNAPLTLGTVAVPAAYQRQQDASWCNNGATVAAGTTCDLSLVLNPSTLGSQNGTATIGSNSLNQASSTSIALTGNAVVGSPTALSFNQAPSATVNALSAVGTVTVQLSDPAGFPITAVSHSLQLTLTGPAGFTTVTQTQATASGVATFNLSAVAFTASGAYTLTATDTTSGAVTPASRNITVNPIPQSITFAAISNQTYGAAPFALGATASSGLPVGYTVTGPATTDGTKVTITGAGAVTVTASQAGNGAYSAATSVIRSFNVAPAVLTVQPVSTQKYVNQANPLFTYQVYGFVNGEGPVGPGLTALNPVHGAPVLSTTATIASGVGTYPITAAPGTLTAANYTFTFLSGTLSVVHPPSPITPNIAWVTPAAIPYGTALSGTQLNAAADTLGSFVYSPAAGTVPAGGTQTLHATFTPADTADYTSTASSVSLAVNPVAPAIQYVVTNKPVAANTVFTLQVTVAGVAGGVNPGGSVSVTLSNPGGSVNLGSAPLDANGSATFTSTTLAAGNYTAAINYGGNANYTSATSNPVVNVAPAVNIGSSAGYTVYVTMAQAGQLANIAVLTGGVSGLDFSNAGRGTCAAGTTYAAGAQCSVRVTFAPIYPGLRAGAVVLTNAAGSALGTTFLSAVGIGPQIAFQPAAESTIGSGYLQPSGVAVDAAGSVYITDSVHARVIKQTYAGGSFSQTVIGNTAYPFGIAVDAAGTVYVADDIFNNIQVFTPGPAGYTQSTLPTSTLNNPQSIFVDASGNLYIADMWNLRILKETRSGSGWVESLVTSSTLSNPQGVAADSAGNVYIADTYNGRVLKETLTSAGYVESVVTSGSGSPSAVTVDANDNVYISLFPIGTVLKETPNGSGFIETQLSTLSNPIAPQALALDGAGNLYIASAGTNSIFKESYSTAPSLAFLDAPVGSTSADSPQIVTVTNTGNAPLGMTGLAVSSTDYATTGSTCTASTSLIANASCTLQVNFQPQRGGPIPGTLRLTDNALNVPGTVQTITLSGTGAGLTLTPATLPNGAVGTAYSQQLSAAGGTPLYHYAVTGGSPPNLVTLSTGGLLSGTPSTAGTYNFTVTATDSGGVTGSQNYSITIAGSTPASVILGKLNQTYLGTPLAVTVTTNPTGLAVSVTYNGSATAPTDPGSYTVVATITNPSYSGSATGTLVIAPAPAALTATTSGLAYSRVSQTYTGTITIRNTGSVALPGPFRVVMTKLTSGVTLVSPSGSLPIGPYLDVTSVASLAPGGTVAVPVAFQNPSNVTITFTPVVY